MHKKLEGDLISLAHSVLQMKNKEDVFALKEKAHEIYEKLSVLSFVEEYINTTPNATKTKDELLATAEKAFEAISNTASDTMKKSYEKSMELMGEMGELSKKNMEAVAESTRITTKGFEEMGASNATFTRGAYEKGIEAAKSMSSAQSVQEAMELQATYTKSAFEAYLEQVNSMTGKFASLVREASAPINTQAGQFVSMMQKTA